jgi:hypothetical protein
LAPYTVAQDSAGRYQISLGYAKGEYEYQTFSCSGERLSSTPVDFETVGAQIDLWPSEQFRVSGFGGSMSTFDHDGPYGGFQLAGEWRSLGLGIGLARVPGGMEPDAEGFLAPSIYARFGPLEPMYLQLDLFAPSPTFGATGWLRAGIGFNRGHSRRIGGLVGVAMLPYSYADDATPRVFGEIDFPLHRSFDLGLRGSYRPGVEIPQWGAGVAVKFHLGR